MSLLSWLPKRKRPDPAARGPTPTYRGKRPGVRLRLEALEDRCLPSTFYAATASDLIADIKAANLQGGANTIVLTAPTTSFDPYRLTAADNTTDGPTVLPVIASGDALTIRTGNGSANPGFGDTIDASRNGRLFDVASGGSLTLENVTLQNGLVIWTPGGPAKGGAIYNQGTLVLSQVMVQNNTASSYGSWDSDGGGIWSNGSLTVENSCVFQGNSAKGGAYLSPGHGGNAFGGAIYIASGTANITGTFFGVYNGATQGKGNTAQGAGGLFPGKAYGGAVYVGGGTVTMSGDTLGLPPGAASWPPMNTAQGLGIYGAGGWGYGGGLCVAGGTVTLTNDSITNNEAGYGPDGFWNYSIGYGGGIYISFPGKVYLDSFTRTHTQHNYPSDIVGTYILQTYPLLLVSGFPSPSTAGVSGSFTVTSLMSAGATWTTYTGTVHFTSSDPQAALPADYTFTSSDQGVHTFTVALKTAGTQSITATDTATAGVTGTDGGITVNAAAASKVIVAGFPSPITAGVAGSFTVTARDSYGNIATTYLGTVHFTSSDGNASLPANYTFTASDAGVHTFSATLKTAGTQSITATDTTTASITSTDGGITVNPAAPSKFVISAPSSVTAGVQFSLTVKVEDAYGNVVTGYTGTIHLSSSDTTATLPKNYTFTAADKGVHTFTSLVLKKKGYQKITITDTLNSSLTASVIIDVL